MSKNNNDVPECEHSDEESRVELFDNEITNEDYGFILGPDGELKSVFMPLAYFEVPDKVRAIFKTFGIANPDAVQVHSIH